MKPLNIQIVDDSELTTKKLKQMLEKLGHDVIQVSSSGKVAIFDYSYVKPDVITMDITMPDMDGIEATRRLKAADKDVKIVMVSAVTEKDKVMDAIRAGAVGYVTKPIEIEKLEIAIKRAYLHGKK
ncbi:MAG: response regulator [Psychrosphaera sp.]|nr:response regulator [Psychrosphaera sp.]